MCTEKTQNRRNHSGGSSIFRLFFLFLLLLVSTNCVSSNVFLAFDITFSDEILEGPSLSLKSVPASRSSSVPLARFYYSVNWFSSARPVLRSLKSPVADKKRKAEVRGGESSDDDRRKKNTGTREREEPRRRSLLFTFRTNSISSGFCLIANAVGGKVGAAFGRGR